MNQNDGIIWSTTYQDQSSYQLWKLSNLRPQRSCIHKKIEGQINEQTDKPKNYMPPHYRMRGIKIITWVGLESRRNIVCFLKSTLCAIFIHHINITCVLWSTGMTTFLVVQKAAMEPNPLKCLEGIRIWMAGNSSNGTQPSEMSWRNLHTDGWKKQQCNPILWNGFKESLKFLFYRIWFDFIFFFDDYMNIYFP